MSIPDRYLDEPDECLCETHGEARPCPYCKWDALEQRAEELREGLLYDRELKWAKDSGGGC